MTIGMSFEQEHFFAAASPHIGAFRRRVAEQEALVEKLEADRCPADEALKVLALFKEALRLAEEHRQLRRELSLISPFARMRSVGAVARL
jgi:exonuclease VII small subunit